MGRELARRMARGVARAFAALALAVLACAALPAGAVDPPPSAPAPAAAPAPAPTRDPDSVVVRFRAGVTRAAAAEAANRAGVTLGPALGETGWTRVDTGAVSIPDALAALRERPEVAEALPNHVRRALGTPDDTFLSYQDYLKRIRAPEAWEISTGSPDVSLAIIDSGVDVDHPDLAPRLAPGRDFVDMDADPDDITGHGTWLAGVAAAATNNGRDIAGISWAGSVIPVRVTGGYWAGDAEIAMGMDWALDQGADVVLLAFGGLADGPVLRAAVADAIARDAVVIAAVGGFGTLTPVYPAAYPGVLPVTDVDHIGAASPYSNLVAGADQVTAPGTQIWTTCVTNAGASTMCHATGPSLAAGMVAGVAMLVRALHPQWTAARVVEEIRRTAQDVGPLGRDVFYGYGMLDARSAVEGVPAPLPAFTDANEPNGSAGAATPLTGVRAGRLWPEGDEDWFRIPGVQAGQVLQLSLRMTGPERRVDPVLTVYDPAMRVVARANLTAAGDEGASVPALQSGDYSVSVTNASHLANEYTHYELETRVAPGPTDAFLSPRVLLSERVNGPLAVVDVTGDGLADVVGAVSDDYHSQSSAFVRPGLPGGGLGPAAVGPLVRIGTVRDVAVGDVDGDGDLDVAFASGWDGTTVHLNDGGTLSSWVKVSSGSANRVDVVDLSGDGTREIVKSYDGHVSVVRRVPDGWLGEILMSGTGDSVAPGDLDGDGDVDFVSCCTDGHPSLHLRGADGAYDTSALPTAHRVDHGTAAALDVTGDGRLDAVVGGYQDNGEGGWLLLHTQTADGALVARPAIAADGCCDALGAADVDGNGRTDVVGAALRPVWQVSTSPVAVFRQCADGTFPTATVETVAEPYRSGRRVALGDLTGDGRVDMLGASPEGRTIRPNVASAPDPAGPAAWVWDASPGDGSRSAAVTARPRIAFARALDPASVTPQAVLLRDGMTLQPVPAEVSYDAGARAILVAPGAPLHPERAYSLTVTAVRDAGGQTLPAPVTMRFRTTGPLAMRSLPVEATAGEAFTGAVAALRDPESRAPSSFVAAVDWGDGTVTSARVVDGPNPAGHVVVADHVWASAGPYRVTVTVAAADGGTVASSAGAQVAAGASPPTPVDPSPPPPPGPPAPDPTPPPVASAPVAADPPATLDRIRLALARVRVGARPRVLIALSRRAPVTAVLRRAGRVVARATSERPAGTSVLAIPGPRRLAAGRYRLTVSVAAPGAASVRTVAFTVVPVPRKRAR